MEKGKETVEETFVHPFIETVVDANGNKSFRVIELHRDRVKDYVEGKTVCIMRDDGVPLALARQEAFMAQLKSISQIISQKEHYKTIAKISRKKITKKNK